MRPEVSNSRCYVKSLAAACVALGSLAMSAPVLAQSSTPSPAPAWPQQNVQFILPFGPGSGTDIAARLLAERLQAKWGKAVVIENRAGGDGLIAIRAFLAAKNDHVLLYSSSASFVAHPYTLTTKVPYDLATDFAPIARVADTLLAVSVPADLKVNSIAEWVALAKTQAGKLNGAGAAGVPELHFNAFIKSNDLQVTTVPYRDIVQAGTDLSESRIHFLVSSYAIAKPHAESGRTRILVVGGRERSPLAPGIPSAAEAGFPILNIETTSGLYGPSDMPRDLRERIAADVMEAVRDPLISQRLSDSGQAPSPGGPDALAQTIKLQETAAAAAAKVVGVKPSL